MTYCVAMRLEQGMIFAADSRTNAGVDHIATFRKLHRFEVEGERLVVIMSAGNLATTQSVLSLLRQRARDAAPKHILNVPSLYDIAELVGGILREVIDRDAGQRQSGVDFGSSFLVGGQIRGEAPRLFHVYPAGNFIEATVDTPYFQIGESKYGKPIIDRVVDFRLPLEQAMKCALISFDSTIRSNLSVGLPLDAMLYDTDSFDGSRHYNIDEHHAFYRELREAWSDGLRDTFRSLPPLRL
jgi:putative proteasome-type protease